VQPLEGLLVVDLTRHLPGPFATRELRRLGARIVRVEQPDGDPMRTLAPAWDAAINAGKESVVCDLKAEPELAQALCARADVVVEGFRPGVASRLGVGPQHVPESVVYCSITGFGVDGPHAARAGHDLNYLGWSGVLADTAPGLPPVQVADLGAGALAAVAEILAALLQRERSGRGARLVVSMTHGSHRFVAHRLADDPGERMLTGGLACYRIYETADGRWLTVGALEPKFFRRLCELLGRPELAARQLGDDQEVLAAELAAEFARRPLDEWLALFDDEDVAAGPVWTRAEAATTFGLTSDRAPAPSLGEHTAAWRERLGFPSAFS
jgi:alpha-methylacyl-CoA racemase